VNYFEFNLLLLTIDSLNQQLLKPTTLLTNNKVTSVMSLSLKKHSSFSGRKGPVVILVADGVGVAPAGPSNAVSEANTPTLDALAAQTLYTELAAHGTAVGLPSDDDMGNSEVGHNAIGAGRIFAQGAKLVNQALESGDAYDTKVWKSAVEHGTSNTLHLLGLHSDGNIHAHTYAKSRRARCSRMLYASIAGWSRRCCPFGAYLH
jgi:hypothetical protein